MHIDHGRDRIELAAARGVWSWLLAGAIGGATVAGVGGEGADAEGLAGDVAVDGVAAPGVHAAARVRRRAAPAAHAQLERLVRRRLRADRRRPVHQPLHRHVVLHHHLLVWSLGGLEEGGAEDEEDDHGEAGERDGDMRIFCHGQLLCLSGKNGRTLRCNAKGETVGFWVRYTTTNE
jgi:hypothetical protein